MHIADRLNRWIAAAQWAAVGAQVVLFAYLVVLCVNRPEAGDGWRLLTQAALTALSTLMAVLTHLNAYRPPPEPPE